MPTGYYSKHTAANYGGGQHFSLANSANPIKSNGGSIFGAGLVPGTFEIAGGFPSNPAITNAINWPYIGAPSRISEPLPYLGGHAAGVTYGIQGGTFATMSVGTYDTSKARYIIFGDIGPNSRFIAGLASTIQSFPANGGQHPWRNAFAKYIRTTLYVTQLANGGTLGVTGTRGVPGGWYYVTGVPVNRGYSNDQLNAEVNPGSYAIPGDVIFLSTGKSSTTKVLPAKTD